MDDPILERLWCDNKTARGPEFIFLLLLLALTRQPVVDARRQRARTFNRDYWMKKTIAPRVPVAGPLTTGLGVRCQRTLLDCSERGQQARLAAGRSRAQVFLDPLLPLSSPSVVCAARAQGALLLDTLVVFSGHDCPLWRPDNALGCFWNATTQSFEGAACVTPPTLSCACSHLVRTTSSPRASFACHPL